MKIRANGVSIEVEDSGADGSQAHRPAVLLVMGLGMQLVSWPLTLIDGLKEAGYRVVRFDNRDSGLSANLSHLGVPNVLWATLKHRLGFAIRPPYSLKDMARDAVGVLDALGIRRAHVLGMSMGGMIAQRMALTAPERVLSLTSLMSSSGARGLPEPQASVMRTIFSRPASEQAQDVVDHFVKVFRTIGSPGFPADEADLHADALLAYQRGYNPGGTVRQLVAIAADTPKRANALPFISCPTLVVHGRQDPLVPFACAEDTARRIPGAHLVGIEGMGHDLPPGVVDRILPYLLSHLQDAGD